MYKFIVSERVREAAPGYRAVLIEADVVNGPTPDLLKSALDSLAKDISTQYPIEAIKDRAGISATRAAYKALGKDPNRYRPSHEQLMRRIVRGLGLYNVDALVDTGNLISITIGSSIGVFDREKIVGDTLTLGRGEAGEPYEGIGRGPLNIEGLPVLRDAISGIGTPTSDNERTKVDADTRKVLIVINMYSTAEYTPEQAGRLMSDALARYCSATAITTAII